MRIALGVEYNGSGYYGFQAQQNVVTIAGTLQEALSKIANEPIYLHCAGRTDANVHATGQVVHFDTKAKRHIDAWIWGTNAYLPQAIVVRFAQHVDYSFHARFSAIARRYRFVIFNHPIRPALLNGRVTWHYYPLDVGRMNTAAQYLIGEQDFSSFRASQCNSKSAMRHISFCHVARKGDFVILDIEANAFLHHMVRNIAGVLIQIGSGDKEIVWMKEVLLAKDRRAAAETAPPHGLYLTEVRYPESYHFPPSHPPFLI